MATIELLDGGIKIEMFSNDHNPPHIHVKYAEHKCLIVIQTGEVYSGYLPPRKLKVAMRYLEGNRQSLLTLWKTMNNQ
ncbi:DUF4160 domain-containing protein [Larkinella soli]|uniref:DUF4160 domain-containing protein n=1 Tax=Larkinella soli TaxID=1770527 RepID=UPI000FFB9398|nr:DUF4160 domain-containing protein [Larkinella soli]